MGWIAPVSRRSIWLLLIWGPKGCGGSRAQKERLQPLTRIGDVPSLATWAAGAPCRRRTSRVAQHSVTTYEVRVAWVRLARSAMTQHRTIICDCGDRASDGHREHDFRLAGSGFAARHIRQTKPACAGVGHLGSGRRRRRHWQASRKQHPARQDTDWAGRLNPAILRSLQDDWHPSRKGLRRMMSGCGTLCPLRGFLVPLFHAGSDPAGIRVSGMPVTSCGSPLSTQRKAEAGLRRRQALLIRAAVALASGAKVRANSSGVQSLSEAPIWMAPMGRPVSSRTATPSASSPGITSSMARA